MNCQTVEINDPVLEPAYERSLRALAQDEAESYGITLPLENESDKLILAQIDLDKDKYDEASADVTVFDHENYRTALVEFDRRLYIGGESAEGFFVTNKRGSAALFVAAIIGKEIKALSKTTSFDVVFSLRGALDKKAEEIPKTES